MHFTNLLIDKHYRNTNNWKNPEDEFNNIFRRFKDGKGIANVQGFRWKSKYQGSNNIENAAFVVIVTNFNEREWPDRIDYEKGIFTYYGDNRKSGNRLHYTRGNTYLKKTFDLIHVTKRREEVSPILLFQSVKKDNKTYMRFLGLLAPGANDFQPTEDLVAIWKVEKNNRFQNYRSIFTILKEEEIDLRWLDEMCEGISPSLSNYCPESWKYWVENNIYNTLECESHNYIRTSSEQKRNKEEDKIINEIFKLSHREFEFAAKEIVKLTDKHLYDLEVTRSVKDQGIDFIGKYKIGEDNCSYSLKAIGEAKQWRGGIGVKQLMRLASRMTQGTIGFFVTTSYFHKTAQEEIYQDERPIILICGKDIASILLNREIAGKGHEKEFDRWIRKIKAETKV